MRIIESIVFGGLAIFGMYMIIVNSFDTQLTKQRKHDLEVLKQQFKYDSLKIELNHSKMVEFDKKLAGY